MKINKWNQFINEIKSTFWFDWMVEWLNVDWTEWFAPSLLQQQTNFHLAQRENENLVFVEELTAAAVTALASRSVWFRHAGLSSFTNQRFLHSISSFLPQSSLRSLWIVLLNWNCGVCLFGFASLCGALRRAAATNPQTAHQTKHHFIQLNRPIKLFNFIQLCWWNESLWAPSRQINSSTISSFLFFHQSFLHLLAANKFKEMNWLKRMKSWWIEWRWPMPHPAQQSQTIHNSHSQRELWNCFGCCWCCAAYPTGLH